MIPTITTYLYRIHHEKAHWLTQAERRRCFRLTCALALCITALIYIWLLY
jgi:hypothetical protein